MKRINKIKLNLFTNVFRQIIYLLLRFLLQSVFIHTLGIEYLGLNGIFGDILSFLAISELGLGSVLAISLYKNIANSDDEKIIEILSFYRLLYRGIGALFIGMGLAICPFLKSIFPNIVLPINIGFVYILTLLNAGVGYFFFVDIQYIIINEQKYIVNNHKIIFDFVQMVLQATSLVFFRSYYMFLASQLLCSILYNIVLKKKAKSIYPILYCKANKRLSKSEKINIIKKSIALFSNSISAVIINASDRSIITRYLGLFYAGVYSNYTFILASIIPLIGSLTDAISPTIGHYVITKNSDEIFKMFKNTFFVNSMIAFVVSITFYFSIQPFIVLWVGSNYLLEIYFPLLLALHFFLMRMRDVVYLFKYNFGLLEQDKFRPIIEALSNLAISILLVKKIGIIGVELGTLISYLLVSFIWEPHVLFAKSPLRGKFRNYLSFVFKNLFLFALAICTLSFITSYVAVSSAYVQFAFNAMISAVLTSVMYIAFNFKSPEFKYFSNLVKIMIKK